MSLLRPLALLLVLLLAPAARAQAGTLRVHFLDVGQGDAILVVSPTGKTVLIDGGPPEAARRLTARVRQLTKGPLDLVLLTHPHLDHLGGLTSVIRDVGARRFMDPGFDHPSRAYQQLLDVVGRKVGQVVLPQPDPAKPGAPLTVGLGDGALLTLLWPRAPREPFLDRTRSDPNSNSIVAKLTYGRTAVWLAGDAEPETEAHLLDKPIDFRATVLKVPHHGGRYSSTLPFLQAVRPQAAVISVARVNDYGHPTPEALARLAQVGARVYRTDLQGEVVAESDGTRVTLRSPTGRFPPARFVGTLEPDAPVVRGSLDPVALTPAPPSVARPGPALERAADARPAPYVSLEGSEVFHRADCPTLARARTKERTYYPTREAALKARKRPAKDCDP